LTIILPTRDLALAGLFAALVALGAIVSVPFFGPIPFTLQVVFVLLAGLVLGARLGALSLTAYLVMGLVAPVYAQGASGPGTLVGPAGGYLFGFVIAAGLVGWLAERFRPRAAWSMLLVTLAGLVPIYALGATWLALQLHTSSFHTVVWGGIVQFLPGDVAKAVAAALAARALVSLPLGLAVTSKAR
jgi:biotin transport system substrate-specific component